MNAHTFRTLSPAQAAQAANTSRWSVMRAINAGKLPATRDNRNCWRIAPENLAAWRDQQGAHPAQCADSTDAAQVAHLDAHPDAALRAEIEELRVGLAVAIARGEAAEARATAAETDRDAWRAQAERLAARPARRSWWPWSRF